MKAKTISAVVLVAGMSVGSGAIAANGSGAFIGVSLGGMDYSMDGINGLARTGTTEHVRTAAKVSVGYWFNQTWGVSANYVNGSQFTQTFSNGQFDGQGSSVGVSLLGRYAMSPKWTLIGKINIVRSKLRQDESSTNNALFSEIRGKSNSVVLPGIELGYRYSDSTTIFFEMDPRGSTSDKVSLGYAGFGLRWEF